MTSPDVAEPASTCRIPHVVPGRAEARDPAERPLARVAGLREVAQGGPEEGPYATASPAAAIEPSKSLVLVVGPVGLEPTTRPL